MKPIFFLMPFSLVVSACFGPYDAGGLSKTLSDSACRFAYDCCDAQERSFALAQGDVFHTTKAECEDEVRRAYGDVFAALQDAQERGRIEWDTAASESCFRQVSDAADQCNAELFVQGVNCDVNDFITGLVESGAGCYASYECAEAGSLCVVDTAADDPDRVVVTRRGVCKSPLENGEACNESIVPCQPELYCDAVADECTGYLNVDDNCLSGICRFSQSYCDFTSFTCVALLATGDACDYSAQCLSDDCDLTNNVCAAPGGNLGVDVDYAICTGEPLQ